LIADLEDPVPLTISIVDSPCVYDAIFTSIKGDGMVEKAGRRISNATLNKITKVFETMKNGFDEVQHLMSIAETERQVKEIESIKEDIDMDKDEMKAIIKEAIKEETNPLWEQLESMKTEEPVVEEVEEVEVESEPSEADKLLAEVAKRLDTLEDKLGNPTPQSIKGEDKPEKPVVKGLIDRDVFGRRLR
jgi:hypothetical protein